MFRKLSAAAAACALVLATLTPVQANGGDADSDPYDPPGGNIPTGLHADTVVTLAKYFGAFSWTMLP